MQQKSSRYNKSTQASEEMLGKMFAQARVQFGDAVKSFWFYDGDLCPACTRRPIGMIKFKDKNAFSLNAFIYRERGVLIGYFLCEICANQIFRDARKNPYTQTPLHAEIERNLIAAYHAYQGKMEKKFDCKDGNPFIKHLYTADPSAHVWGDGRLYVYPSQDIDPPRCCDLMDRYHVFSTDDLVNWVDHGEIFSSQDVPWGRREGGFMWAPDCMFHKDKYYYYFPHPSDTNWNDSWKIGVAVSDQPASDFKVLRDTMPGLGGFGMIDPAVFKDDDGTIWFVYGGAGRCLIGKLKDNMVEIDGQMTEITSQLEDYHEGPMLFKREDVYYLIYPDNTVDISKNPDGTEKHRGANRMHYAMARHPLGPWMRKGILLDSTDCDTTHGSVVEFKGQWYLFYHNSVLSGNGCLRSCCFDKVFFNADGTIQMVKQTGRLKH